MSCDEEALLQRLAQRLKRNVRDNTTKVEPRPIEITLQMKPPTTKVRNIESIIETVSAGKSHTPGKTQRSTLRYFIDSLDEGKRLEDILPMKRENEVDIKPEIFPDLDAETEQAINKRFQDDARLRISYDRDLDVEDLGMDNNERPRSPGAEYDVYFTPGELGISKPRFKAEVHERLFKSDSTISKTQLKRVMDKATEVEKDLMDTYTRHTSLDAIQKRMMRDHRKKRRAMTEH